MTWPATLILAATSAGLTIDSGSPGALCPALEPTRAAVQDRLGAFQLSGPWRATYTLVHREDGDYVELTLIDPQGEAKLTRSLPVGAQPCAHLSQAIALVLERYFRRLDAEPPIDPASDQALSSTRARNPDSDAPQQPSSAPQDPAATRGPSARDPTPPAPDPGALRSDDQTSKAPPSSDSEYPGSWRLALTAGVSVTPLWLAPSLGVAATSDPGWALALRAAVGLWPREEAVGMGRAQSRPSPISLVGGWQSRLSEDWTLALFGGGTLVLETAHGEGLVETSSGLRATPAATVQLSLGRSLGDRLRLLGSVDGYLFVRGAAPAFQVSNQTVLTLPLVTAGGALWLELAL